MKDGRDQLSAAEELGIGQYKLTPSWVAPPGEGRDACNPALVPLPNELCATLPENDSPISSTPIGHVRQNTDDNEKKRCPFQIDVTESMSKVPL